MTSFQPLQPAGATTPCPFLAGAAGEREAAAPPLSRTLPRAGNVCLALGDPAPISLQHQTVFCLGGRAQVCSRYRAANPAAVAPASQAVPQPPAAAREPRRLNPRLAIAALALATGVGVVAALMAVGNPFDAEPAPSGPAAAATVAPTIAESGPPAATATPIAVATEALAPTASPAPTPLPTATPARYTVQPGDSLTRLAVRYGVSVADLAAANGLPVDARLQIGQTLQLPPRAATSPTPAAP